MSGPVWVLATNTCTVSCSVSDSVGVACSINGRRLNVHRGKTLGPPGSRQGDYHYYIKTADGVVEEINTRAVSCSDFLDSIPASRDMPSNVTILYQPLGPRRTAALVHRATFTSNTREMLLRPIPESGTIQTAFESYPRIQSPDSITLSFVN